MPGPWYFAYVAEGTAFNAAVHNVYDERIWGFSLEQDEGDFAAIELTVRNKREGGPLAPNKDRWAYLSFDYSYVNGGATDIRAEFYGRILAVPSNIQDETWVLTFIAKPVDYDSQRETVAATKRTGIAWDPIWFPPETRDDPNNVLQARPELWAIDRKSHVVTTSNIINGEDGTLSYDATEVFYDQMEINYGEVPLRTVRMTASVDWDMIAGAAFDISDRFGFSDVGSRAIVTFTGKGLEDRWPKSGASLGNGWTVVDGSCKRVDGQGANVYYTNSGDFPSTVEIPFQYRNPIDGQPILIPHNFEYAPKFFVPLYLKDWLTTGQKRISVILRVVRWRMLPTMIVRYDVSRKYSETVAIELSADVQDILTDAGGEDVLELTMSSSEVATPIDPGGLLPIGDVRRRRYLATDRGAKSIEFLLAIMRSRLLVRARCVYVTFDVPFKRFMNDNVTMRKNAAFADGRLPGTVGGKITKYRLTLDGSSGKYQASITIGCTAGHGGTVAAIPGEGTWAAPGYMQPGYQQMVNNYVMPVADELVYKSINGFVPNDDGLDLLNLTKHNIIKSLVKENSAAVQEAAMANDPDHGPDTYGSDGDPGDILDRLDGLETRYRLVMRPMTGGPFHTDLVVETLDLKVPKTIDLERPPLFADFYQNTNTFYAVDLETLP